MTNTGKTDPDGRISARPSSQDQVAHTCNLENQQMTVNKNTDCGSGCWI